MNKLILIFWKYLIYKHFDLHLYSYLGNGEFEIRPAVIDDKYKELAKAVFIPATWTFPTAVVPVYRQTPPLGSRTAIIFSD